MRRVTAPVLAVLILGFLTASFRPSLHTVQAVRGSDAQVRSFIPVVLNRSPVLDDRSWDPRLNQRGAFLIPAQVQPGQGYWRLVKAVWYDENEPPFAGMHHILMDTLNDAGNRQVGVPISVTTMDGSIEINRVVTEAKPGELFAANSPMWEVAPFYRAAPAGGVPADAVSGMGMGSIALPAWKTHTSYGLVWKWTVAASPTATTTAVMPPTEIPSVSPPAAGSPIGTPTATPTVTVEAGRSW